MINNNVESYNKQTKMEEKGKMGKSNSVNDALGKSMCFYLNDSSHKVESLSISQLKKVLQIGKFKAASLLFFFVIIGFAKLEIKEWRFNLSEKGMSCVNEILFEKKCNQCKLKKNTILYERVTKFADVNPPSVYNIYNTTNVYNNIHNDYRVNNISLFQAIITFSNIKVFDLIDLLSEWIPLIIYLIDSFK